MLKSASIADLLDAVDPDAPQWFRDAVSIPRTQGQTSVAGCAINYWRWGPPGVPGVVLVHGGGAHAHWWDHIAPWLVTPRCSVVAVDLSGNGDSDHRSEYRLGTWAEEILAAGRAAGLVGPPVLVGHSLGGWSTTTAAAAQPDAVRGLVLVDSRVVDPAPAPAPREGVGAPRPHRVYRTMAEAVERYRPEPAQDGNLDYILRYLAVRSLRPADGGWRWKFDPAVVGQRRPGPEALARLRCPVCVVRGERGLVTDDIIAAMERALGAVPVVTVPLGGHHVMLDQPLSLVSALRAVLALLPAHT